MDNKIEVTSDKFEPHGRSDFVLKVCDEDGNSIVPHYIFNSFTDKGGDKVIVTSWIVDHPDLFSVYEDFLENGNEDHLVFTFLASDGKKDVSVKYENVDLEDFYFGSIGHNQTNEEDPLEFQYEFSFGNKRFINERDKE